MLELNQWFFALLLNFLALLYILNKILFKPVMQFLRQRDSSIKDSLFSAKAMDKTREDALAALNKDLSEARNRARETFEKVREEGLNKQKEILDLANKQAFDLAEKARLSLKADVEGARLRLRSDVERFSEEIVRKLIGA